MLRYRLRAYLLGHKGILALCWLLGLALVVALCLGGVSRGLTKTLQGYIQVKTQGIVAEAVNRAVLESLESGGTLYTGLVTIRRDAMGSIDAVDTDTAGLNRLKAQVGNRTLELLQAEGQQAFSVPVGTLLGSSLLLGRGPAVSVRLMPVGSANTRLVSEFSAAGINQTLHRMTIEVEVAITVIMPGAAIQVEKSQQVLLGETVIVGQVPDSYTYIDDTRDSRLDKVLDYQ